MAETNHQSSGAFDEDERRGVVWVVVFERSAHRRPFPSRKCQSWFGHGRRRGTGGFAIRVDRRRPPSCWARKHVSGRPELRVVRRAPGHGLRRVRDLCARRGASRKRTTRGHPDGRGPSGTPPTRDRLPERRALGAHAAAPGRARFRRRQCPNHDLHAVDATPHRRGGAHPTRR